MHNKTVRRIEIRNVEIVRKLVIMRLIVLIWWVHIQIILMNSIRFFV